MIFISQKRAYPMLQSNTKNYSKVDGLKTV